MGWEGPFSGNVVSQSAVSQVRVAAPWVTSGVRVSPENTRATDYRPTGILQRSEAHAAMAMKCRASRREFKRRNESS